jgi:mRNA-degrading endonuclease toxin of MazEF toxin-antitoxin module
VVLSNDVFNRRRKTVVVVPITSGAPESLPLTVAVDGNRVHGVAAIEHIRGVAKERFASHYDTLDADAMERIGRAVADLLDLV